MKFKKSLVWLIALIMAVCIVFTGCNSSENKATDAKETKQTVVDTNGENDVENTTQQGEANKEFSIEDVPAYSGDKPYVVINNNQPNFDEGDLKKEAYEYYSPLDSLGRCGYVMACVCKETMPTGPRGSITHVNPTGWKNNTYDIVDSGYLYNRCHLIGWQLTGEDANKSNLITGTRYMNWDGMVPFENEIADYVKDTGNHVMYRVTPIFAGDNLLATGVHLEAYSVEDNGGTDGICFNVFVYNVQPGIVLDYATGENHLAEVDEATGETENYKYIINKNSGTLHKAECASAKTIKVENRIGSNDTVENLVKQGYTPCSKCKPN